MPDRLYGNMLIVDPGSDLVKDVPGLELPTIQAHTYVLIDDDARECRVISDQELYASYVDDNIDTFQLQDIDLLTLDADNHYVTITYSNGAQTSLLLGSISYEGGRPADQFVKRNGVIYAIDDSGHVLLDATNTPNLVAMRTWYWQEAKRVIDERVEIAEIVHAFTECVGHLGHTAHFGH